MRVQRVAGLDSRPESWTVLDDAFAVVDPIDEFLAHLTAIERSPGTVRSYAFDLRDYFHFLGARGIDWRTVRLEHLGRFVGWLRLPPAHRCAEVTAFTGRRAALLGGHDQPQVGRRGVVLQVSPPSRGGLWGAADHDQVRRSLGVVAAVSGAPGI